MYPQLRPVAALCLVVFAVNVSSGKQGGASDTPPPATTNVKFGFEYLRYAESSLLGFLPCRLTSSR
jgi:hypothetical protein